MLYWVFIYQSCHIIKYSYAVFDATDLTGEENG